jgi:RNA polymerase sigma factor (sigma-70 family)
MAAEEDTNSKVFALRAAQWIGCSGAHKKDGKWMPCETHEELERISNEAEPQKKTGFEALTENYTKRKAKGKKKRNRGWEKLKERKPLGFATLEGGGIVSAPIVAFPNVTLGNKSYIPGVSPRDNDPDVFTDIESARKRSRMLGCIGVRRMPSSTGRTIWMPCTNNSDYSRLAGTTFLGRRNQREAQRRMIRTILRREMANNNRRNKIRKKSLFDELNETKGIGRAIGRAASGNSLSRRLRRSVEKIEGVLNPLERRDMDGDGFIFDGTWREMRAPRLASSTGERPEMEKPSWVSPTDNRWMKPAKIGKGGPLKASELLNYDRLRIRKNRDEQARVLGVTRDVIDAMHEPDASIDAFDADRLTMSALGLHPALIWGESWLDADKQPKPEKPIRIAKRTGKPDQRSVVNAKRRDLNDRDRQVLEMRRNGKTQQEIADEIGVSKERARQILNAAIKRNEDEIDKNDGLASSTSSDPINRPGQIPRDSRGNILKQGDRRKETLDKTIEKLKSIGFTQEEINLLMTGDAGTPVDTATRDVDIAAAKRGSLASRTTGLASMTLSEMARTNSSEWAQNQKTHIVDWANSRPSFNVPYSLAQQYKRDGDLKDSEWKRLLRFYTQYGPENRGLRSTTEANPFENVGAKRMAKIILDRVRQDKRNKKPGERTHYHVVGPGAVGKTTLRKYLVEQGIIPGDSESAHVDPDFIKQGIEGYNGGAGSMAVHRESAYSATRTVNNAANEGMDIVTEGTGYRLFEYKTTSDPAYKKVLHIPYLSFDEAEKRLRKRNAEGKRQLPESQIRIKGQQFYGWLADHIQRGEVQDMYIWDMDVPKGAAPRVIAKIENGVFRAIDEPAFKKWSEQSGGHRGGDANLAWFKRRFPEK